MQDVARRAITKVVRAINENGRFLNNPNKEGVAKLYRMSAARPKVLGPQAEESDEEESDLNDAEFEDEREG